MAHFFPCARLLKRESIKIHKLKYMENIEENIIRKNKSDFRSRLALIFFLGFLIGIAIKTEALKKITIGYDDYLMKIKSQSYNINKAQTDLQKQAMEVAKQQEQESEKNNAENNPAENIDQVNN